MFTTAFDPFGDLDRLGSALSSRSGMRSVPVDLTRDGDQYVLTADLPGVDPGSIDIEIDGQLLTVRAERTAGAEGTKWITRERPHGSVLRQFTLGEGLDTENITARYDHGVLSLVIPVSERAKRRKITVSEAETPREAINA